MDARKPKPGEGSRDSERGATGAKRATAAPAGLDASRVEDWMADRHDVAPAVWFRPAIIERDEP